MSEQQSNREVAPAAERERAAAEHRREVAEERRETAEAERSEGEQGRLVAEELRRSAEELREAADLTREHLLGFIHRAEVAVSRLEDATQDAEQILAQLRDERQRIEASSNLLRQASQADQAISLEIMRTVREEIRSLRGEV